jgi:hypothetical protein
MINDKVLAQTQHLSAGGVVSGAGQKKVTHAAISIRVAPTSLTAMVVCVVQVLHRVGQGIVGRDVA